MKRNKPRCKNCKERFDQKHFNVRYCDKNECFEAMMLEVREKQRKSKINAEKKATNLLKEKLKTKSDYEKDLEREINHIVRLIDEGCTCISCGHAKRIFAGHYHSVGANKTIRFHLDNIHRQDYNCNGERGGNTIAYGKGLIEEYGREYKDYVEYDLVRLYPVLKWTIDDLKVWIKKAREIVKELKQQGCLYGSYDRLNLRAYYNQVLGIYN